MGGAGIPTSELWVFGKPKFEPALTAPQIAERLGRVQPGGARGINPIIHHLHSKPDDNNPASWLWKIVTSYGVENCVWFYLSRYDVVRQAVSFERALFLDEWLTYGSPKSAASMPYDPAQITYEDLLKTFWEQHDPTQGMRQGHDRGTQYRSASYTTTDEQRTGTLHVCDKGFANGAHDTQLLAHLALR